MPSPLRPAANVACEVLTREKKVKGRKRHLLVDTLGLLLGVSITGADVQDRDGAKALLAEATFDFSRLKTIRADGGYAGQLVAWAKAQCGWALEIIRKKAGQVGFEVLPKRWVVERSLGWLTKKRRLAKSYEILPESEIAFIQVSMIHLMIKRLA